MNTFILLQPIYQERVWGGHALETTLGRQLPQGNPIGESWEIVDRPEAQSVIVNAPFKGKTLRELIERYCVQVMGPAWDAKRPFPILVKWLDCHERLSLQVHPPASVAPALKGEPKTENWYIAHCKPDSHLIVGLKKGATRSQFEEALKTNTLEPLVNRFPVKAGDSILVHSGEIHAIDGGNLILEIQQNSDTTYRVYDWGRVGLDGKPRQMHIQESLASIKWDDFEPQPVRGELKEAIIADAKEFRIRRIPLAANQTLSINAEEQVRILSLVNGKLTTEDGSTLLTGDNAILPYAAAFKFTAREDTLILLTENFS